MFFSKETHQVKIVTRHYHRKLYALVVHKSLSRPAMACT